jgi:hypothetical protein
VKCIREKVEKRLGSTMVYIVAISMEVGSALGRRMIVFVLYILAVSKHNSLNYIWQIYSPYHEGIIFMVGLMIMMTASHLLSSLYTFVYCMSRCRLLNCASIRSCCRQVLARHSCS